MVIRVLPVTLANQIAAGEVVERPASVLKELLENSLDAGARRVRVRVQGGGAKLLQVEDDGAGIAPGELSLALARHATSKIQHLDDLASLASMGFRGEALPSIASVARLTLRSCQSAEAGGWEVYAEGSADVSEPRPAAQPPGTTVTVRDLFFNTPARRKFLRTERTEQRHVEEVFKRVALSRFDVAFALRFDERAPLTLRAGTDDHGAAQRLGRLFGKRFVDASVTVDAAVDDMRLRGWLSGPGEGRAQADCQYLYVNGRSVRDSLLRHALRLAFQDRVEQGRHPAYALYLEVDPATVDVNVHPTKHELRFTHARLVHDFVFRAVERAIRPTLLPAGGVAEEAPAAAPAPAGYVPLPLESAPAPAPAGAGVGLGAGGGTAPGPHRAGAGSGPDAGRGSRPGFLGRPLTSVGGRVVVSSTARGLVLIDAHRARKAAWRARLTEQHAHGTVPSRPLLLPATLRGDRGIADVAERWAGPLERSGLQCRRIGPGEVSVRALPVVLGEVDAAAFAAAVLGRLPDADTGSSRSSGPSEDGAADTARAMDAVLAAVETCDPGLPGNGSEAALDAVLRELERALGEEEGAEAGLWAMADAGRLLGLLGSARTVKP